MAIPPGYWRKLPYDKNEPTILKKSFIGDDYGVFKFPDDARIYNEKILSYKMKNPGESINFPDSLYHEAYNLYDDYFDLITGNINNELSKKLALIKSKNALNPLDNAILKYVYSPVNNDGFRSIDFSVEKSPGAKKILLLGDSFTFGHRTSNLTNSFYDILLARGYHILNTGISGSDIPQYYAVFNKFFNVVQPDLVIVNLYIRNDIEYYERKVKPNTPIYESSNKGNLFLNVNGKFSENSDTLVNNMEKYYKLYKGSFTDKVFISFALTSLLGKYIIPTVYKKEFSQKPSEVPLYKDLLMEMDNICKQNGAKLLLVSIPDCCSYKGKMRGYKDIPYLFDGFTVYEPSGLNKKDYAECGHYNDSGHKKHADFIEFLIKNVP